MSSRTASLIRFPRWTRPAPVGVDGHLHLALHRHVHSPSVFLHREGRTVPVPVIDGQAAKDGSSVYEADVTGQAPGLYDLEVVAGSLRHVEPHAVCVLRPGVEELRLVHCSDLHLLKRADGGMQDRTAHVAAMVERLNALRPDLVVCTGDLISRYDAGKQPLPSGVIRWQIRWLREHLAALSVPLYVTVGNHDVAFDDTRDDWYAAMGRRAEDADDWSVNWGRFHLTMMDCFIHYDRHNVALAASFTPRQLVWLQNDLTTVAPGLARLLFAHYDYSCQLPEILPLLGLDAFFYGHSRPLYPDALERHAIWDGHLPADWAYRAVRVTGRCVVEEDSATWEMLAP